METLIRKVRVRLKPGLLLASSIFFIKMVTAAPAGGNIVGGAGHIHSADLSTVIHQNSSSLAINWQSFNVNANERVQFVQPGASSIALNRILSNSGSQIQGRIDANGQVVLVNPNGIFFGPTASVNVGGLIASGLDIDPVDFMNGNYIFNEVLGTEGTVINAGLINASLGGAGDGAGGGSVALIGKKIANEGVINAQLGAVNLAAGKEAVLTFDSAGLIGVRVSKAVLQDELGIDPAVLNSGEINAEGGRILLTASVSQDVFSQVVNSGDIKQATSVVVNADGSFTLGAGADVVNSGSLSVSTYNQGMDAGQIVVLGDNVTSSGVIKADAENGSGGNIELHSNDTTRLTGTSLITARSESAGKGGKVKVLGNKAGLFDSAVINVSGANGGGEVLIGGDKEGQNQLVRNAEYVYLGSDTQVKADALYNGSGGKIITFASDSARIYGDLFARGGIYSGNGGFIETSGLKGFDIQSTPDVSAFNGKGGQWLIDPYNLSIINTTTTDTTAGMDTGTDPFSAISTGAKIEVFWIENALKNGDVIVKTTSIFGTAGTEDGDIVFDATLNYDGTGTNTLTLKADRNITFFNKSKIYDSSGSGDILNVNLFAKGGVSFLGNASIKTQGGNFTVGDTAVNGFVPTGFSMLDTSSVDTSSDSGGGDIAITSSGNVTLGSMDVSDTNQDGGGADAGGAILVNSGGNITLAQAFDFNKTYKKTTITFNADGNINIDAKIDDSTKDARDSLNVILNADKELNGIGNVTIAADVYTSGGNFTATSITFDSNSNIVDTSGSDNTNGGDITITTTGVAGTIATGILTADGGTANRNGGNGVKGTNGGNITLTATSDVTLNDVVKSNGSKGDYDNNQDFGQQGGNGGNIDIISSGNILVKNTLESLGGDGDGDNGTGNGADPGDGGNGGNITLSATSGTVSVESISTTGGAGIGNDYYPGTTIYARSGDAGNISITATTVTLNNDLNAQAGAQPNTGTLGNGSDISINGATTIGANVALNASGTTRGNVTFGGVVSAALNRNENLTITANDVTFSGALASTVVRLGDVKITATGDVNAGANAIFAKSLDVTQSNSFTSGNIDTSGSSTSATDTTVANVLIKATTNINVNNISTFGGTVAGNSDGRAGGNVDLQANIISVAAIDTRGSAASGTAKSDGGDAGSVTITATEITSPSVVAPSIVIGGDIKTSGGALANTGSVGKTETAQLTLNGNSSGAVTINHTADFTNAINIAGDSNSTDTLTVANGVVHDWIIDGSNSGSLNFDNITFTNIEKLVGGSDNDNFDFTNATSALTSVSGGSGGTNKITGNDEINSWVLTGANQGEVGFLSSTGITTPGFSNIQEIIAGTGTDTLTGRDNDSTWTINLAGSGYVEETVTTPTDSVTFSNFENITGGNLADDFILNGTGSLVGEIIGGNGADSLTLNITDGSVNNWIVSGAKSGSLAGVLNTGGVATNGFSNIESIKGSDDKDVFTINNASFISNINGGNDDNVLDPDDVVDFSGLSGSFSVTLGSNSGFVNIDEFIGSSGNPGLATLVGEDTINTWIINGANKGTINGFKFSDFGHLTGGNVQDTFNFTADLTARGSLAGVLDGGANSGTEQDIVNIYLPANLSGVSASAMTVQLESPVNSSSSNTDFLYVNNIDQIKTNSSVVNTLRGGTNTANDWALTGAYDGTVDSIIFNGFTALIGGDQLDTFTLPDGITFAGSIDGGGNGVTGDKIIAGARNTDWVITGANAGNVTGVSGGFTGIENLTGNAGDFVDVFNLHNSINFAGSIDGGGGTADKVLAGARGTNWTILTATTGSVEGVIGGFSNVEILQGNAGDFVDVFNLDVSAEFAGSIDGGGGINDRLIGGARTAGTDWAITGANNTGKVTGLSGTFSYVENLEGNTLVDVFQLHDSIDFDGSINGGGGINDRLIGGARTAGTNWTITDVNNTGTVTGIVGTFSYVENLEGNTLVDVFQLHDSIDFAGSIDGGGGINDRLIGGARTAGTNWTITDANNTGTVTGIVGTFTQVESLEGNTLVDVFQLHDTIDFDGSINGGGGINDKLIGGARTAGTDWAITDVNNTGKVTGLSGTFSYVENLEGNTLVDVFQLHDSIGFDGSIDGGGGTADKITAGNVKNIWDIDTADGGIVTGLNGRFDNIENFSGGNLDDTFTFQSGASITGVIDGGAEGVNGDQVDMSKVAMVNVVIGAIPLAGSGVNIVDIEQVTGNDGISNRNSILTAQVFDDGNTADNIVNSWDLFADDGVGDINDGTVSNENGTVTFINFSNLKGSDRDDIFTQSTQGDLSFTSVDGGTQQTASGDQIDFSSQTGKVVVDLNSSGINSITGIERMVGNGTNSTLMAKNSQQNNWLINANNSGTLNVNEVVFFGFNILSGGDGVDNFVIQGNGSIGDQVSPTTDLLSAINGGAGNDTLTFNNTGSTVSYIRFKGGAGNDNVTVNLDGTQNGAFVFDGETGNDSLTIEGTATGYDEVYTPDIAAGYDQLKYSNAGNVYSVNFVSLNGGTLSDNIATQSLTVNGSASADTFNFGATSLSVDTSVNAAATRFLYANKGNLLVDGLGQGDTININADFSYTGGNVLLRAENIISTGGAVLTANNLVIDSATTVGASGNALQTDVTGLSLVNVNGDVFVENQNQISIDGLTNVSGSLSVVAKTGNVTEGTDLVSGVNLSLAANNGDIVFDSADNQLTGDISLSGNSVIFNNNVATRLNNIIATTLNITSAANITDVDTGVINVSGSTVLTANGQDVILDGPNNQFTDLTVTNVANLVLADANSAGLTISNVNVSGDADITAAGDLLTKTVVANNIASLTTAGAVIDGNGTETNITAATFKVTAVSGIGGGDAIETRVSTMDVVNTGSGEVELAQTGVVSLVALKNLGTVGDITFSSDADINMNPGSVVANRDAGDLLMSTTTGSFLGLGEPDRSNPDITAQNATFFARAGTFGTQKRFLVLDVPGSVLIDTRASYNPVFNDPQPASLRSEGINFSVLGSVSALAGQQLVEVESLDEIDPAIFTDLKNYSKEEISIRMPEDQLFEDELERYRSSSL